MTATSPILEVSSVSKHYKVRSGLGKVKTVKALNDVSFAVGRGETLGIVGESGCGKSTLAKVIMNLEEPTTGGVHFNAPEDDGSPSSQASIQMVFQDPMGSLNPRKKVRDLIAAPLFINTKLSRAECYERGREVMTQVGLDESLAHRYPHMLSGGQRQRVGIARAIIQRPSIVLCDEPVSALDASVRAQVLNLLMDLQDDLGLTYLFISHDLSVIEHISNSIMVIYLGRVVEYGPSEAILTKPLHPYTQALIDAAPSFDKSAAPKGSLIRGELPSPLNPPPGCPFNTRCPKASERCRSAVPSLREESGRKVACFHI